MKGGAVPTSSLKARAVSAQGRARWFFLIVIASEAKQSILCCRYGLLRRKGSSQ
jgi:hypothetical protein